MSESREDEELRREFEAQRVDLRSSGRVPDFETMMANARAQAAEPIDELAARRGRFPGARTWAALATAAAAAMLVFVVEPDASTDGDAEFEALVASYSATTASGAFASPTSGLLDIPGVDLGTVPSVGSALSGFDRSAPRPGADEGRDS